MIRFPNCKINIGLNILSKREDGYHNLQTIFYPVAIYDALELIEKKEASDEIEFTQTGLSISGDTHNNLCVKAYQLLKKDFPQLPAVQMHLHKVIPMGAGLGGGSSDAAFTLKLLNEKFQLGLSKEQLIRYAAGLGSDCAFFVMDTPCIATGRGEIMKPVAVDLSSYSILIVNPGIHISTADAFKQIEPGKNAVDLERAIQSPIEKWKDQLKNDFELPVFQSHPEIAGIKKELYEKGALYASMSGSGSSLYGIFPKGSTIELKYPDHYFLRWI